MEEKIKELEKEIKELKRRVSVLESRPPNQYGPFPPPTKRSLIGKPLGQQWIPEVEG